MKREVFADPEVMKAISAQVVPVMVYEDSPGGEDAFRQYNVEGTPITICHLILYIRHWKNSQVWPGSCEFSFATAA